MSAPTDQTKYHNGRATRTITVERTVSRQVPADTTYLTVRFRSNRFGTPAEANRATNAVAAKLVRNASPPALTGLTVLNNGQSIKEQRNAEGEAIAYVGTAFVELKGPAGEKMRRSVASALNDIEGDGRLFFASIRYAREESEELEKDAVKEAIEHAREYAAAAVAPVGELGEILTIDTTHSTGQVHYARSVHSSSMRESTTRPRLPIAETTVPVTATVVAVFRIKSRSKHGSAIPSELARLAGTAASSGALVVDVQWRE